MARWVWWVGAVLRFVLVPMLGVAAVAWWVIGDQSEDGGGEAIADLPTLQDHPARVGAIGVLLLVIVAVDLLWTRPISPRSYASKVLPPVLLGGVGIGLAVRIITSRTVGANIGGGLAILFGPILLIGMVVWAVAMLATTRRRRS